jgi:hypothetical protein
MPEPGSPRTPNQQTYSKSRLAGLDAHTTAQKRATVDRLTAAIKSLKAKKLPISIKTIREECGLEYNSIKRNSEALLLYQRHSTFLKSKHQQMKSPQPIPPSPHDPFMSYKKPKLVIHLREEMQRRQEVEAQYTMLLEEFIQKDILIAELQAKIAEYEEYLGRLRIEIQREEHGEQ